MVVLTCLRIALNKRACTKVRQKLELYLEEHRKVAKLLYSLNNMHKIFTCLAVLYKPTASLKTLLIMQS